VGDLHGPSGRPGACRHDDGDPCPTVSSMENLINKFTNKYISVYSLFKVRGLIELKQRTIT